MNIFKNLENFFKILFSTSMRYHFADCILDTDRHEFCRGGEAISIEPQVFDLLHLLLSRVGYLVSHDELLEKIWEGRIVSESTISARINAARKAVGDTGKEQKIIKTVPRRGIQLIVSVHEKPHPPDNFKSAPKAAQQDRQKIRFTTSEDGTEIAYATSGAGTPVMRAGHWLTHLELDWHSPVWRPTLDFLGSGHMLVRYDQRGTGLSKRQVQNLGVEVFAQDLKAVADACGLDRFPIVASSQGAPIAIEFAANNPDRVSKLVFWGGYAEGWKVRDGGVNSESEDPLLPLIQNGWGDPESAWMQAFTSLFFPDASSDQVQNMVAMQLASASPKFAMKLRQTLTLINVTDLLEKIQAPTLVIHAQNDCLQPLSQGKLLASRIPNAEFMMMESSNHIALPQDEVWEDMVKATLEFIE